MSAKPLTQGEIADALRSLRGWKTEKDALVRELRFGTFREAMSFMVRIGFEAESMDHHPEWTNVYNRLTIRLNTHDAGGKITAKDVELAKRIESIQWTGEADEGLKDKGTKGPRD